MTCNQGTTGGWGCWAADCTARCKREHKTIGGATGGTTALRRGDAGGVRRRCGVAALRRGDAAASGSVAARRRGGAVARRRGGVAAWWRGGAVAQWRGGAVARRRGGVAARWRGGADPEAVALECALPLLLKRWPRSLSGVRALSLGVH